MKEPPYAFGCEIPEDDPRQIDVDISEWTRGTGDSILYNAGIDTCLGVAISDPDTQMGTLATLLIPLQRRRMWTLCSFLLFKIVVILIGYWYGLGGIAEPVIRGDTPRTELSQSLILRRIGAFGLTRPDIKWGGDSGVSFDMRLLCATGTCQIEEIDW